MVTRPDAGFWRGKRVLLTGHTGFKGAWLAQWLHRMGALVHGAALPPATTPNLYTLARVEADLDSRMIDLRDAAAVAARVRDARPQLVLHLAAQSLVRAGYRDPLGTFATNVMGTAHLLDALREAPDLCVCLVVTTDKVYRDRRWPYPYREADELGGHDPYSASKAAAELVCACYRDAFLASRGVALASARAGNVIGGGDWSDERLVPDLVRAWGAGQAVALRHPQAVRPWQHVLEPLAGYLRLCERLWHEPALAGAWNFGPGPAGAVTVHELVALARRSYGHGQFSVEPADATLHETSHLALEVAKARDGLDLVPRWALGEAIDRTMAWYRQLAEGADARRLCAADIDAFEAAA